jgi:DNA (cytosine-5)-methyltransferase 1
VVYCYFDLVISCNPLLCRNMTREEIPVIDIFAGPGGLAEGFSRAGFDVRLSVEMDQYAHQTLRFRSFCRKLIKSGRKRSLIKFYSELAEESRPNIEKFSNRFPELWKLSVQEAIKATLGEVDPREISSAIEGALRSSKHWVLLGGPPCQAYSLVGRSRMRNANDYRMKRGHDFEEDHRHHLYKEYLRIVASHAPSIFVMENVKGLLSSQHNGTRILEQIKKDLNKPRIVADAVPRRRTGAGLEYELHPLWLPPDKGLFNESSNKDFVVEAERQAVPQARHRLFIVGLRKDLNLKMEHLEPSKKTPNAWNILKDLPRLHSTLSKQKEIGWLNYLQRFPSSEAGQWTKENHPKVFKEVRKSLGKIKRQESPGGLAVKRSTASELPELHQWLRTKSMPVALNHESRGHMPSDLHRYLYSSVFAEIYEYSPKLEEFPPSLLPAHKNVNKKTGKAIFSDRFRTQCKNRPSTTITSHIHKDGHYFIHPDPAQCRSLTVREAARLQTFPDDYLFCGPRTEQFKQVGNAVPPFLAYQIAKVIKNIIKGS